MSAAPILSFWKDGEEVKSQPLDQDVSVGRGESCVVMLSDRAISRNHLMIKAVDGKVQIEKKSEFAPLVVNGADCTRAIVGTADVIQIGPYLLKLQMPKSVDLPVESGVSASILVIETAQLSAGSAEALVENASIENQVSLEGSAKSISIGSGGTDALALELPSSDQRADGSGESSSIEAQSESPIEMAGAISVENPSGEGGESPSTSDSDQQAAEAEVYEESSDDAKTRVTPSAKVRYQLVFSQGAANVDLLDLNKQEIYIGRGASCEVVLNDKKSSRKHAVIRKLGPYFTVKDLGSVNGIYVNGLKITEQELSGDDWIGIGDTQFQFKAISQGYEAQAAGLQSLPETDEASEGGTDGIPALDLASSAPNDGSQFSPNSSGQIGVSGVSLDGLGMQLGGAVSGGFGTEMGAQNQKKKKSLIERFREQPQPRQLLIVAIIVGLLYWWSQDDAPVKKGKQKNKPAPKASVLPLGSSASFAALPKEKQEFVKNQYNLAMNFYQSHDYDSALNALDELFRLVDDYEAAKDIKRYAEKARNDLKVIEEEKRRKEDEERLKQKVANVADELRTLMKAKKYTEAQARFGELLSIDPENREIASWKKEIAEDEEKKAQKERASTEDVNLNQVAWDRFKEAMTVKRRGDYHSAIELFKKVELVGAKDLAPTNKAKLMISACKKAIRDKRDPLLAGGAEFEKNGELMNAHDAYRKATRVDPPHPDGYKGMARVREVLTKRARLIFTEAIIAESYSDFTSAKAKFKEILTVVPEEDLYYQRAKRKLKGYTLLGDDSK